LFQTLISATEYLTLNNISIFFIICLLIGGFITVRKVIHLSRRIDSIQQFRERFIEWANGGFVDQLIYLKLIKDSPRTQTDMGAWGIMASFTPPYSQQRFSNWPIILNSLPLIRQYTDDRPLIRQAGDYVHLADEAMMRAIGSFSDEHSQLRNALLNPLSSIRIGITTIITLPLYFMMEFGILSRGAYNWIRESIIVKTTVFMASIIAFLSAIVGLVTGWASFVDMLRPALKAIGLY
jgi:hypothetical protein